MVFDTPPRKGLVVEVKSDHSMVLHLRYLLLFQHSHNIVGVQILSLLLRLQSSVHGRVFDSVSAVNGIRHNYHPPPDYKQGSRRSRQVFWKFQLRKNQNAG